MAHCLAVEFASTLLRVAFPENLHEGTRVESGWGSDCKKQTVVKVCAGQTNWLY